MMSLIDLMNTRYACKKYDPSKKVSDQDIAYLMESIRLAPTSFCLQVFKVLVIGNDALKKQLRPVSWNQSIIEDASHLFVFCHYTGYTEETLQKYAELRASAQGKKPEDVLPYIQYIRNTISKYSAEQFNFWAAKQTYIALGNVLLAAAERGLDATPVEGFDKVEYDTLLNLKDKGLASAVVAVVGYRTKDEYNQFNKKVRKSKEDLFEFL